MASRISEPKQYMPHSMKSSLGMRLGANRHVISLSATAAIEKVFQAHYLQYKTYCIRVEHNLYIHVEDDAQRC